MEDNRKMGLEALRREMEEMRAAYEAKISELEGKRVEKKGSAASENARFDTFLKSQEAWLNEYVEIKLFKDNDKYKDDVYVAINGKNCVVRRGEWTRIRRKFAMLLDQSEIQDLRTAQMIEGESEKFRKASRAMGA